MYGSPGGFRPRGGGRAGGGRGPPWIPSPDASPHSPEQAGSSSSSAAGGSRPNAHLRNPSFSPSRILQREGPRSRAPPISVESVEAAVAKAQRDFLAAGQSVSAWKVSQAAALALQLNSWGSLGFGYHDVPTLRQIQLVEGKVNAFIHCFVSVRRMTTVHDLDVEICRSEGVEQFEELGLGALLRQQLVQHYFSVPSDVTEVCKIRVEDLISRLSVFLYRAKNKEITVEEFLDFLVQKYSVATRENLGVRIQSLGLYIKFIKGARRTENFALKSLRENGLQKEEMESSLDAILHYMKPLSSPSVDCSDSYKKKGRKKSSGNEEKLENQSEQRYEIIQIDSSKVQKLEVTNEDIRRFVATWKEACQKHTAAEVLALMLHIYGPSEKQKRKMLRLFLSYPGVGLLNVAVQSIKFGLLDIVGEDNVQSIQHGLLDRVSEDNVVNDTPTLLLADMLDNDPLTESEATLVDESSTDKIENRVTVDDIVKQISAYFGLGHLVPRQEVLPLEKRYVFRDCEIWLKTQFSIKEFKDLGFGNFLEFLNKHASLLPNEMHCFLTEKCCGNPSLEVSMLQQQLVVLLSQAARNLGSNGVLNKQLISVLLRKQFPSISFQILGSELENISPDLLKNQNNSGISCSVYFSGMLLGNCCNGNSLLNIENISTNSFEMITNMSHSTGSFSAKDAIKCLLKAPLLSDLQSWSHWDLIFAPSLGPLLDWLLNEGYFGQLSCIVTCDGRILRIDNSATFDEVLEAFIQGSSFKVAVKLLTLFAAYGGAKNVPVSLLKCYAKRAIEVIIKNTMDRTETETNEEIPMHKNSLQEQGMVDSADRGTLLVDSLCSTSDNKKGNKLRKSFCRTNEAYAAASKIILNCLGHLPSEFCSFAAEILVSGLQIVTHDAAAIILSQCKRTDERVMLHDIGLSLGIVEWIEDYHEFSSAVAADLFTSPGTANSASETLCIEPSREQKLSRQVSDSVSSSDKPPVDFKAHTEMLDGHEQALEEDNTMIVGTGESSKTVYNNLHSVGSTNKEVQDANFLVETIRREEFGLDPDLQLAENSLLKKQHARLGRALHCLSQELYSQDSHFLLELVQNADDNSYPDNVQPTLVFILKSTEIIVLNNEKGFSEQNIRALCDVGNSTKKGSSAGYIGQKGIGFKSVFRVTDAPEIHSNGFHVKFDISEGEIGFVCPTIIPPYDINHIERQLLCDDQTDTTSWNTCIVLPFNSKLKQGMGINSVISMFSELHPSLLLFLHRIQCIKFKNMLDDKLVVLRRETLGDGMVMVSHGKEKMSWLVVSCNLQAHIIRHNVKTTKIAIAFTLQKSDNGDYKLHLDQQPVFAFLPLRKYGLKFILQGDFVLPSSREEVDGDSAWNQWLLSEFPDLFIKAEKSFYELPCFQESPGKAVTVYMSFVPLVGEVHGFFSRLPRMIISKLRMSNCLLLDGPTLEWVHPHMVLRGWDDQVHTLLPEGLLQQHLGLGYLNKDIILSDSLARALGIQEYGPELLIQILSSICHEQDGIRSMGLDWLALWLNALYTTLSIDSSGHQSFASVGRESHLLNRLREIPFIPLSDGSFGSMSEGPIWLPSDDLTSRFGGENILQHFPGLSANLRVVTPFIFSTVAAKACNTEGTGVDNLISILHKIGLQLLSAHDIIKQHIMPSISDGIVGREDMNIMIEYLSFVMVHFQSVCSACHIEKADIISFLQTKPIILTNHGYKCPNEEPIHFSKEFGNSIDIKKLIDDTDIKWNEIDAIYLKLPGFQLLSYGMMKWREFFQELGVNDFVQVVPVRKKAEDVFSANLRSMLPCGNHAAIELFVKDWESVELVQLLSALSSKKHLEKCKYLLEVLDKMWDDCFSAKAKGYTLSQSKEDTKTFKSSFMGSILSFKWVASSMDEEVHYPSDLFYDCEAIQSILGTLAPYAIPKLTSGKFLEDIGFKIQVTLDDALRVMQSWRKFENAHVSISSMSKFYTFIRDEMAESSEKTAEVRSGLYIFIPFIGASRCMDVVPGTFMSPNEVFWHDPTGCMDLLRETILQHVTTSENRSLPCTILSSLYPGLHDFFVTDCGVLETPPPNRYLQILLQLSYVTSPKEASHEVFQVFLKWADDLRPESMKSEDLLDLKESLIKPENTVLPTIQDKWVSLHPQFGLICWADDKELMEQFMHFNDVSFLQFGELNEIEKKALTGKVAGFLRDIGIPALSEVVTREPIYYGMVDATEKASLVNWVLPYAQRYISKLHHDIYIHLKQSGFEKLSQLQIVVVEELFYRNTLKGHDSGSKRRLECSCILQGNILYASRSADSYSLFLELSRFLFHGAVEPYIANFLHTITLMAELGSPEEQLESYIVNSQKVPQLPDGEPIWSLLGPLTLYEDEVSSQTAVLPVTVRQSCSKFSRKITKNLNWPPTNWKNAFYAPDGHLGEMHQLPTNLGTACFGSDGQVKEQPGHSTITSLQNVSEELPGSIMHTEDQSTLMENDDNSSTEDDSKMTALLYQASENVEDGGQPIAPCSIDKGITISLEPVQKLPASITVPDLDMDLVNASTFIVRDRLCMETPDEDQSYKTGRLGEIVAFKYFTEKLGATAVKWVNEETETGLPYDLIIEEEGNTEFIEVKTTTSTSKDWFPISTREWHCAAKKGDSFSIARVFLSGPTNPEIVILKNPWKLCQQRVLQLALLMPCSTEN
ncbi:protein NO VEIN isoform X2 [Elaeis guineensis]|uniref:Uncharacterized protein LOC105041519 isoform X2 n=1 Tax=Elaeis guineensis var. tenera TaxID=51953 RepID=A0A8N4F4L4_ELAGV|nr:uncharacterized protein LOC105041519 isoform X2 [Elaeis guineensis]